MSAWHIFLFSLCPNFHWNLEGGWVGKFQLNLQLNATLNMWLIRNFSIANNQPPNPDSLVDFFNLEQTETSIRRGYTEIIMGPLKSLNLKIFVFYS